MNKTGAVIPIEFGVIDERELVNIFATDKQKRSFMECGGKFKGGKQKEALIKQAERYCEIEAVGDKKYKIVKVHKYPVPKNYKQMNEGLHRYLTPLILISLITAGIYQVKNLTFTTNKWYSMVEMINRNYMNFKLNMDLGCEKLGVSKNVLRDFYNSTDDALVYFFKKSLEHLKAANLFNFQEINWVYVKSVEAKYDENEKQYINVKPEHRRATALEMVFIRKCEELASKHAGIRLGDESAKYYGPKSKAFLAKLKELLMERSILFCYKAYEIYSTDYDIQRCYQLLECFESSEKGELIRLSGEYFRKHLEMHAENRVRGNPSKRGLLTEEEVNKFLSDYKEVINVTMAPDVDVIDIPNGVASTEVEHINRVLEDKVEMRYGGKVLKIGVEKDG